MDGRHLAVGGIFILMTLILYSWITVFTPITNALTTIIDIEVNMIPVEPYDVADIEKVTDSNNTHWELIVKLLDVETNSTIYDYCTYDICSKSFSGSKWIKP